MCRQVKQLINVGDVFGRWTVLSQLPSKRYKNSTQTIYLCRCECGVEKPCRGASLRKGSSKSCGCLLREWAAVNARNLFTSHGYTKDPLYQYYRNMFSRCRNAESYVRNNIRVCERWSGKGGFLNFKEDVGEGYKEGLTFDRIDPLGDYCSDNCRWVEWSIQHLNKGMNSQNTSGRTGVYFDKSREKWVGRLQFNGKSTMKRFDTREEAEDYRVYLEGIYLPKTKEHLDGHN